MDELRKNHIVVLSTKENNKINGIVVDFEKDRVMILICEDSIDEARKINELDNLLVHVHTHCGIKKMKSSVISSLNFNNCIVIENNPAYPVVQKREHVRVLSSIIFKAEKNGSEYRCICINISAGGIAFLCHETNFGLNDELVIKLPKEEFGKEIALNAKILKVNPQGYAAQYINPDKHDADKIVKYVFSLIAKK